MRACGADVPKGASRAAMLAKGGAATALPKACPLPCINVGEKVFIRRVPVMIETQVHRTARGANVSSAVVTDCDVVNKTSAQIEPGNEVVAACDGNAMVADTLLPVRLAHVFVEN